MLDFIRDIKRLRDQPEVQDSLYYFMSILMANDKPTLGIQSQWCGYTNEKPKREIRKGSLYYGDAQRIYLREMGEPPLLINKKAEVSLVVKFGGHALIIKHVAEEIFSHLTGPHICLQNSGGAGYIDPESLPDQKKQHAPSRKVRMQVLNRDKRRCSICGRSPMNHVDLELDVHHLIPWGKGGITEEENLTTLCNSCHDGLYPHFDYELMWLNTRNYPKDDTTYDDSIVKYHEWVRSMLKR